MLSLTYGIRVVVELLLQTWPKDGEVKYFYQPGIRMDRLIINIILAAGWRS
jgi:hypothetical protein